MIQITPNMSIFVACKPVDFRKGHDGLCRVCKEVIKEDPFSGAVFVFCNSRRDSLKLLFFDRQGLWVCHKRLSQGKLKWWPESEADSVTLDHRNLLLMLWNGDVESIKLGDNWK